MKKVLFITAIMAATLMCSSLFAFTGLKGATVHVTRNSANYYSSCYDSLGISTSTNLTSQSCMTGKSLPRVSVDEIETIAGCHGCTLGEDSWRFWDANQESWRTSVDAQGFMYYGNGVNYYYAQEDGSISNDDYDEGDYIMKVKFKWNATDSTVRTYYFQYWSDAVVVE